ncbi:GATA transcription factor 7-like [Bidens hawaiensis]|uniref:GATA transcription factor 7-like n=1 Tax=Bidens hawaiensis TaxID=980011 RepID=UPI00404B4304
MECIEARALKSSFLPEIIGMKSSQQAYFDDFWRGINNVVNVSSDDFSVDDLLDLSDKEFSNPDSFEEEELASVSSDSNSMNSSMVSSAGDQLPVPIDDMESLEWLSQIVDDSVSEIPILYPPVKLEQRVDRVILSRFEPVVNVSGPSFTVLGLPYPVPRECRSEGSRKPGRVWSSGSRSRTLTDSSSSSSSSHDSSITSPMLFRNPVYFTELFEKPPAAKKQRKSPAYQNGPSSSDSASQRRCTHCQVQKTPQWRTGPLGPKTLCNACGVQFKSGRLYPEYRPACSPTFSVDVHSNSYRKVLEMRKRKEVEVDMGLNLTVQT